MKQLIILIDDDNIILGQKRDDLHDWVIVDKEFRLLKEEVQKAIIAKLMIEKQKGGKDVLYK